jgi:diadenosine tetraphosphatase ApaH/serine/threonine PP2A family protein phosphatase
LQIVDGRVLCVHGGLSPEVRTLDQIRTIPRAQEIPHEGAFCGKSLVISRVQFANMTIACYGYKLSHDFFFRPDVVGS